MVTPTVHLNGTSRQALLEGYVAAARAVREAMEAVQAAAPNARDYYVQGPAEWGLAQKEHRARLEKLEEVRAELEALAEEVAS